MKRRWFVLVGGLVIALPSAIVVAFGFPSPAEPATALLLGGMILAGVLFVLGGLDRRFGGVEWYQFVGVGNVLVGVSLALGQLIPVLNGTTAYDGSVLPALVLFTLVGGGSIVFIGADWIRGGHHFDLSVFESGPLLSSGTGKRG
ncbi:hypothetical protein [Halococcus hamelinensis]|uniref:Uncharacterized protein n=1 Tax=Halococcus hamelinensis 100A6 TaxID=1132509 RepID=M0M139_9EURY|nr:hypothetical protein [Halococcus hamelinensis]EMA38344.1 hypothetical protein C447_09307 [Halococcus hamelinensis 100A6]